MKCCLQSNITLHLSTIDEQVPFLSKDYVKLYIQQVCSDLYKVLPFRNYYLITENINK